MRITGWYCKLKKVQLTLFDYLDLITLYGEYRFTVAYYNNVATVVW